MVPIILSIGVWVAYCAHYIHIQPHAPIYILNAISFAPLYDIDIVDEHIPGETNHAGGDMLSRN